MDKTSLLFLLLLGCASLAPCSPSLHYHWPLSRMPTLPGTPALRYLKSPSSPQGFTWLITPPSSPSCWCSPLSPYGERAPFLLCCLHFNRRSPELGCLRCYSCPLPPSLPLSLSFLSLSVPLSPPSFHGGSTRTPLQ